MNLIETINLLSDRVEPNRDKLKPEDIHTCIRHMWLKHRNVKPVPLDAKRESFKKSVQTEMINWIKACGYAVIESVGQLIAKDSDGNFYLLIIEALGNARYKSALKNGIPHNLEFKILSTLRDSAQLSSRGNTLDKCIVLFVNRNDFDAFEMVINADNDRANLMQSFLDDAQTMEEMPAKNETYECNFCPYKSFCENNEVASVNCRTCANVSLVDGEFHCPHGSSTCDNHIYHPQLMECAGYTVHGADPTRMIIDYGDFVNAPAGTSLPDRPNFTSKELYKAAGKHDWHKDEKVLELMALFDGRLEV